MNAPVTSQPGKITQETRFAVVMYGGISLAIYMNGIAQELLNMVRSTSDAENGRNTLTGTASVYKEIAAYLSTKNKGAFKHKFVVDIISGTSAGGINGVCLAKGLVCGLENLKTLERVWLNEGDVKTLLNDRESEPVKYPSKEPKTSAFNSQRMYGKLLDAFRDMDEEMKKSANAGKSHVESMDLFVTATDLRGLQRPILLSDGVANERMHKHVFPFLFRQQNFCSNETLNHFTAQYDKILAFASRCTSSFPIVFEPVTIENITGEGSDKAFHENGIDKQQLKKWEELFFSLYDTSDGGIPLEKREFADGGYLDNRPFGHAIRAIHAREADCPISRKLLFIDPSPESVEKRDSMAEISFINNSALAGVSLPRYETIREEIDALKQRNGWIEKVTEIMQQLEEQNIVKLKKIIRAHFGEYQEKKIKERYLSDEIPARTEVFFTSISASGEIEKVEHDEAVTMFWRDISSHGAPSAAGAKNREDNLQFDAKDLGDMVKTFGSCYYPYHYTRLNDLSEQIASIIVRAMNAGRHPDFIKTVELIVTAWRMRTFCSERPETISTGDVQTENIFFRNFDLNFRIRRLNFIRNIIEKSIKDHSIAPLFGMVEKQGGPDWSKAFESAITEFYHETVGALRLMYHQKGVLRANASRNPIADKARELQEVVMKMVGHDQADKMIFSGTLKDVQYWFGPLHGESTTFGKLVDELMELLHELIKNGHTGSGADKANGNACAGTIVASDRVNAAFRKLGELYPEVAGRMRYVYDYGYALYDMTPLPLLSGGEYGEGIDVEIYRVSPADAVSLWDEKKKSKPKLAGITLGAFGAFLDRDWRRNDIMWGRLDAAERLLESLLPEVEDQDVKQTALLKAQRMILDETIEEWIDELKKTKISSKRAEKQYKTLQMVWKLLESSDKQVPAGGQKNQEPLWVKKFHDTYDFNRELEPSCTLRSVGRSSAILSSMIERIDSGQGFTGKIKEYLKKLNWILLGMLDFSTPKTIKEILAHYWLQLLIMVSSVLVLLGVIFGSISLLESTKTTLILVGLGLFLLAIGGLSLQRWMIINVHEKSLTPESETRYQRNIRIGIIVLVMLLISSLTSFAFHYHELPGDILTFMKHIGNKNCPFIP